MKRSLPVIALCAAMFVSCSENEPSDNGGKVESAKDAVYVLTQGAFYDRLEGSFNVLDLTDGKWEQNVFSKVNGRSLGATPQCGIVYGDKIYLGIWESKTIEIIDRYTFKSEKQITLSGSDKGQGPRSMVADGGKVYVCMYEGYVARLDTLTASIDATVKVGPNPDKICLANGRIYVPNSDGENWQNNYADGTTVSVVTLSPFGVEKTVTVPLNPTACVSAGGDVFVLSKGNYIETLPDFVPSMVHRIEADGTTTPIVKGNMMASGGSKVYIVNADYTTKNGGKYYEYDAATKQLSEVSVNGIEYPNCVAVDTKKGKIYVASNVWNGTMPGYSLPTYLQEFSLGWVPGNRYDLGVGESAIFFGND